MRPAENLDQGSRRRGKGEDILPIGSFIHGGTSLYGRLIHAAPFTYENNASHKLSGLRRYKSYGGWVEVWEFLKFGGSVGRRKRFRASEAAPRKRTQRSLTRATIRWVSRPHRGRWLVVIPPVHRTFTSYSRCSANIAMLVTIIHA
jgi:hypothetical protein